MKKTLLLLSIAIIAAHSSSGTEGYFKLPHNSNSGSIWSYNLESTFPSITESENYAYGFDGLTKDCYNAIKQKNKSESNPKDDSELIHCFNHPEKDKDRVPIIYISVEKGKTASFKINNFTCKECLYSKVALIQTKKYKEQDSELILENTSYSLEDLNNSKNHLTDGQDHPIKIDKKNPEKAGIYRIFGATPEPTDDSNTEPQQGIKGRQRKQPHYTWSKFAEIHILPYETLPKKMIFVPFNGTGENRWDVVKEKNGFNKDSVIYYFNKVYKQAVLKPEVDELKAEDFGLSEDIEINMTNPNNVTYITMYLLGIKKALAENFVSNKQSPYWHIIYAINKIRKKWNLNKCYTNYDSDKTIEINDDRKYDLKDCKIHPENESENTTYVLSSKECTDNEIDESIEKDVFIKVKPKSNGIGGYYIFDKKNPNKKLPFKKCQYLYTDNGYPIIPSTMAVTGNTGAASAKIDENFSKKYKELENVDLNIKDFEGYLPFGSIIFVPRKIGESAHYVLMHELGHSFGLTDVAKSSIYRAIDQDKNKNADKVYYNDFSAQGIYLPDELDYLKFVNYYGSTESNLMSWQTPGGPKIQYRKTPIVCTGGTVYYKETKMEKDKETGKYYTIIDKDNISYGSIERKVEGGFENQWECIRGKCYDSKYNANFATLQRKFFWQADKEFIIIKENNKDVEKENYCFDNTKWEEDKDLKNIKAISKNSYSGLKNKELEKIIINTQIKIRDPNTGEEKYELYQPIKH